MKTLNHHQPTKKIHIAFSDISTSHAGLLKSLVKIDQCELRYYDKREKPIFDFIEEFKPSIFLYGDQDQENETFLSACNEIKNKTGLVLFTNNVIKNKYIDLNPDLVCSTREQPASEMIRKNMERQGVKFKVLDDYGYVEDNSKRITDEKFNSDICYHFSVLENNKLTHKLYEYDVANPQTRHEYYLYLNALDKISKNHRLKIVGNSGRTLPIPQYLGKIKEDRILTFLNSSKICLDLFGGNVLHQAINGIFSLCYDENDLFPTIDIKNIDAQLKEIINDPSFRKDTVKKAQEKVFNTKNTSYHRLLEIFNLVKSNTILTNGIKEKIEETKCSLGL